MLLLSHYIIVFTQNTQCSTLPFNIHPFTTDCNLTSQHTAAVKYKMYFSCCCCTSTKGNNGTGSSTCLGPRLRHPNLIPPTQVNVHNQLYLTCRVFRCIIYFIYLFIYLNIFIQDIKHNSARLLYVVLLYNKTMWVHKNNLSYTIF